RTRESFDGLSLLPVMGRVSSPPTKTKVATRVGAGRGAQLAPPLQSPSYAESRFGELHFGWAAIRSVRDGAWKYIDAPDPELYDLSARNRPCARGRNEVPRFDAIVPARVRGPSVRWTRAGRTRRLRRGGCRTRSGDRAGAARTDVVLRRREDTCFSGPLRCGVRSRRRRPAPRACVVRRLDDAWARLARGRAAECGRAGVPSGPQDQSGDRLRASRAGTPGRDAWSS